MPARRWIGFLWNADSSLLSMSTSLTRSVDLNSRGFTAWSSVSTTSPLEAGSSFIDRGLLKRLPGELPNGRLLPASTSSRAWTVYVPGFSFASGSGQQTALVDSVRDVPDFQSLTSKAKNGSGLNQFGPWRGSALARVDSITNSLPEH